MNEQIDTLMVEYITKPIAFFDCDGILVRSNRAWEMFWCEPSDALLIISYEDLIKQLNLSPFDPIQMQDNSKTSFNGKSFVVIRHRIILKHDSGIMVEIENVSKLKESNTSIDSIFSTFMTIMRSRISSIINALTLFVDYPDISFPNDSLELLSATRRETWDLSRHMEYLRDLTAINSGLFSRQLQPEHLNIIDIFRLIEIECAFLDPVNDKRKLFDLDISSDNIPFFGDRHVCHHVLSAVIYNAILYSDNIAPVSVSIREKPPTSLYITISDHGWGIPQEEQQNVFSFGFRGKQVMESDISGLGSGLYIARKMLTLVDSEISFTSKPSSGTQFDIILREMHNDVV